MKRAVIRGLCVLGCAMTAAACAAGGETSGATRAEVPPRGHYAPPEVGPAARARETALPDPAADQPVTLEALLAWAMAHAPGVRVAESRAARAEAAMTEARLPLPADPTVGAGAGPRIFDDGTGVDIEASLSQQVEVAGQRRRRIVAARRMRERIDAELAAARWEVHRRVHGAFHRALVARGRAEALERLVTFEERLLDVANKRVQAGDASPLVVRVAEGDAASARQAAIAARQKYEAARLDLAEAAGWPASHPPEPAGTLDRHRAPPSVERLVALAERHDPDLAAQAAAVREAEARVRLADREAIPDPTFGLSWHREGAPNGGREDDVLMGAVSLPLPVWRANRGPRAKARAELAVAQAEYDAAVSTLEARVARTAGAVRASAERVEVFGTEVLPKLEESLHMLERAFELGEIDVLDVSVAAERFLRTQTAALDAYADYFEAIGALEAVVGSDLWADESHEGDRAAEEATTEKTTTPAPGGTP